MLFMFDIEFLKSSKFSLLEIFTIDIPNIIIRTKGMHVIKLILLEINIKYIAQKAIDLIITLVLKTAMIDKECLTRFKKFIFDGPKYLFPLTDGIEAKFFSTLTNAP